MVWPFSRKKKIGKAPKPTNVKKISGAQVKIKIFRDFGSNVNQEITSFLATEVKDGYGGLLFENEAAKFLEEVEFQKDDIYREMQILLKIRNLAKKDQLKVIKKKITHQRKILFYLDVHQQLNGTFNYIDEKLKLRDYSLLYNHVNNINEEMGSFFTIEDGLRTYSFVSKDGFLYPMWFGVDNYTAYPDYIRKHKIKNTEDEIFKKQWESRFTKNAPIASLVVIIIMVVCLFGLNIFWTMENYKASNELALKAQKGAIACQETASMLTSDIMKLLQIEVIQKAIQGSDLIPEVVRNDTIVGLN